MSKALINSERMRLIRIRSILYVCVCAPMGCLSLFFRRKSCYAYDNASEEEKCIVINHLGIYKSVVLIKTDSVDIRYPA